jgi:predicted amidophosphoribosyltransferase
MASKSCPACSEEVSNGAKFCARCGATLDDTHRKAETASDQHMDICPRCGAILAQDATFCHNCGNNLGMLKKKFCSACGTAYVEGAEFCHKCGKAFGVAPQAPTPVPQAVAARPGHCKVCGVKLTYWNSFKPFSRADTCINCKTGQTQPCRVCGALLTKDNRVMQKETGSWVLTQLNVCNKCYFTGHKDTKIHSAYFKTNGEYQAWLSKLGDSIDIISVESQKAGFSLHKAGLGRGKVRYMVTFRRK